MLFFSSLIESSDFALDMALFVSNQRVAVSPHQVYLHYFRELPVSERTHARKDVFIKTRNRVLQVDKTSGVAPMIQVALHRPPPFPFSVLHTRACDYRYGGGSAEAECRACD